MQISKFPLCLCVLALCGGMTLRAADTPAQAAARAALMKEMQQVGNDTNAPAETAAPVETAPATPAPAQTAPPAMATPAPAATMSAAGDTSMSMTNSTGDTAAQAAARAALEQKLQQLGDSNSSYSAPSGTMSATGDADMTMTYGSNDTTNQAAARIAVDQKLQQLGDFSPGMNSASGPAAVGFAAGHNPGELQITAPPAPVDMTKEQKLQRILMLYQSNQISPKQYQDQRAAILAEH